MPLTCRDTGRIWSGWRDLNPRPLRPERSALPSCATPRSTPRIARRGQAAQTGCAYGLRPRRRAGTRVRSVASGGQANRIGAYGEVPIPAETWSRVPGAWRLSPLARRGLEVAVGDQGAVERDADLAAVGVPGEHERDAVGRHRVGDPVVRRVDDTEGEVGVVVGRSGDRGVVVAPHVRVVDAAQREPYAADLDRGSRVGQVGPAPGPQPGRPGRPRAGRWAGPWCCSRCRRPGSAAGSCPSGCSSRSSRARRRRAGRAAGRARRAPRARRRGARGCRRC